MSFLYLHLYQPLNQFTMTIFLLPSLKKFQIERKLFTLILIFISSIHFSSAQVSCDITGDTVVCDGDVVPYSVSLTGNYSYQWNAFGGTLIGSGTNVDVLWTNFGNGQVTLVVRDALNDIVCTAVQNVTIRKNPNPIIVPSKVVSCELVERDTSDHHRDRDPEDPCFSVCDSTLITYSVQNNSGSTYQWIITGTADFTPSTSNTIDVNWTEIGNGSVKVIETDSFGCVGESEICVNIVGRPTALFNSPSNPILNGTINVCLNQQLNLENLSVQGDGSPLSQYEWIWGDNSYTNQNHPTPYAHHQYSTPGTYTLQLVAYNECRCSDTFSVTVVVDSSTGPEIFCVSTVCPNTQVTYYTNSDCSQFDWAVENGVIVSGGGTTDTSITIDWGITNPGIISLMTPNCSSSCPFPSSTFVPIITPTADIVGPTELCLGETYTYSIGCNIPIDSIIWDLPNGINLVSGSLINGHKITIFVTDSFTSGTITVDYFHHVPGSTTNLSCGGEASLDINARPQHIIFSTQEICENETNFSVNHYQSNFQTISGNILWTITDITGNITYYSNLISGSNNLNIGPWTYGSGNFVITATGLDSQFCNVAQSINLVVHPLPPSPDSIVGVNPVCPNTPYTYLAIPTSTNFAVVWDVLNPTSTTYGGNTVSVMWDANGPNILNAYQIDPISGCRSLPLVDTINSLLPLSTSTIFGLDTVCANIQNISYSVSDPGDLFTWSISPSTAGSVTSGQYSSNVEVEWNNYSGQAILSVEREMCGVSITSDIIIEVLIPPSPTITAVDSACQGSTVSFSTPSSGVSFNWDFDNGFSGSGSSVTQTFNSPGTYYVSLVVENSIGCLSQPAVKVLVINPEPQVSISTPDPNIYCGTVGNVTMYVADPAISTTYNWFQNGSSLSTSGVSYSTNNIGTYSVTAVNSFGCSKNSNTITIDTICDTCNSGNVTLDFSMFRLGCSTDSFVGTHSSNAFNPSWNFDDIHNSPSTATGLIATHTYTEPGFYRIRFCVNVLSTNGIDTCTVCRTKVDTIKYKPDFYYDISCSGSTYSVDFTNNTKRIASLAVPPYSWTISPGGFTSTAVNPSFNLNPGSYTVTLLVDGVCSKIDSFVIPALPSAIFTSEDSICVNAPMAFINNSTPATSSNWSFGDGASSLVQSPIKTYDTPNVYPVSLTVSNIYGCTSSAVKRIFVLPNTLAVNILPSDTSICEGDSILYTANVSGGYPAYDLLWSNIQSSNTTWAKFTGSYYVDIMDSKSCFLRSDPVNVLVNPVPKPQIFGKRDICLSDFEIYQSNYPNLPGYSFFWEMQPTGQTTPSHQFNVFAPFVGQNINFQGSYDLMLTVTNSAGCAGSDTFEFNIHREPTVNINALSFPLCEESTNVLYGSYTSHNPIVQTFWNNGNLGDTLITTVPDNYVYTVIDTFGCKSSGLIKVNPLPDFCGYQSGCYEICDTISELLWYAPVGHAFYQWYYNGSPISGATSEVLEVPLYQSGIYQVEVTTFNGCTAMSDPTDITFISCPTDCVFDFNYTIICGPINADGEQTYDIVLNFYNNLGNGAGINVSPFSGTVSGVNPTTLVPGWNAISFNFIPTPGSRPCLRIVTWNNDVKCDTFFCVELPPCDLKPCETKVELKSIDCAGYDNDGNPLYYVCTNVGWGGNTSVNMLINDPNGIAAPNLFTLNPGNNSLCFTYTNLQAQNFSSTLYFTFYDTNTNTKCLDSLKIELKPCPEECSFNIFNNCVHCRKNESPTYVYEIEAFIENPFNTNASFYVLPNSHGSFGSYSPTFLTPGNNPVSFFLTSQLPGDTFICFQVVIVGPNGQACNREMCIYVPPCDQLSLNQINNISYEMKLVPNPSSGFVKVYYNTNSSGDITFEILDMTGRSLIQRNSNSSNGFTEFNLQDLSSGTYFIKMISDQHILQTKKLVITR